MDRSRGCYVRKSDHRSLGPAGGVAVFVYLPVADDASKAAFHGITLEISDNSIQWYKKSVKESASGWDPECPTDLLMRPILELNFGSDAASVENARRIEAFQRAALSQIGDDSKTVRPGIAIVTDLLLDSLHSSELASRLQQFGLQAALTGCPATNALLARAQYVIHRCAYEAILTSRPENRQQLRFAAANLGDSERSWLRVCQATASHELFAMMPTCFDNSEAEMQNVVFWCPASPPGHPACVWSRIVDAAADRVLHLHGDRGVSGTVARECVRDAGTTATWFLRQYDLNGAALAIVIGAAQSLAEVHPEDSGRWTKLSHDFRRMKWLQSRILWSFLALFVPLSLAVAVAVDVRHSLPLLRSALKASYAHTSLTLVLYLALFLAVFLVAKQREAGGSIHRSIARESRFATPFRPVTRLGTLFVGNLLLFVLAADLGCLAGSFCRVVVDATIVFSVSLVGFVLLCAVIVALRNSRGVAPALYMAARLFLPRLLFASVGAWVLIVTNEDAIRAGILAAGTSVWVGLALAFIALIYAVVEVNSRVEDVRRSFRRAAAIVIQGYAINIVVGFLAMNFVMRPYLEGSSYLGTDEFHENAMSSKLHVEVLRPESAAETDTPGVENRWSSLPWEREILMSVAKLQAAMRATAKAEKSRAEDVFDKLDRCSWGCIGAPFDVSNYGGASDRHDGVSRLGRSTGPRGIPVKYTLGTFRCLGELYVMPGFLLGRAFFALFIGLFLQLIFEERAITDPL